MERCVAGVLWQRGEDLGVWEKEDERRRMREGGWEKEDGRWRQTDEWSERSKEKQIHAIEGTT